MKLVSFCLCFFMFSSLFSAFGQKISETNFALGISKTSSPMQQEYWGDDPSPTYLTFSTTKSWYNTDHWVSLRKELGLNLQYSNINLTNGGNGGLGANSHYTGNIISLFANAALLANFRIDSTFNFGIGPDAEFLLIGSNNLKNSYYTMLTNPPSAGEIHETGINRNYFNQPAFGIKLCFFIPRITEKASIGISLSYLWTKSESSDFYAANYTRISFFIGFKHGKKILLQKDDQSPSIP